MVMEFVKIFIQKDVELTLFYCSDISKSSLKNLLRYKKNIFIAFSLRKKHLHNVTTNCISIISWLYPTLSSQVLKNKLIFILLKKFSFS